MRTIRRTLTAAASLLLLGASLTSGAAAQSSVPPPGSSWLELLNTYRGVAAVTPLKEVEGWSAAAADHAKYIVLNDETTPYEVPGNPGYTEAGHAIAKVSLQIGHPDPDYDQVDALNGWLTSAFYSPPLLNPLLLTTGYGWYSDQQSGGGHDNLHAAAVFDSGSGETHAASYGALFPIEWPSNGSVVGATEAFPVQYPDPLAPCGSGYAMPVGLPLTVQFKGEADIVESSASLLRDGQPVEVCAYDSLSYSNTDPVQDDLGKLLLMKYNFAVMIPKDPFTVGSTYTASVTTASGETDTWSFEAGTAWESAPTTFAGASGADDLVGTPQDDVMYGVDGDDAMCGGAGADLVFGGVGVDTVCGDAGPDVIDGGSGNDVLSGGDANDKLFGGSGDDVLRAGPGRNRLNGGPGRDVCVISGKGNTLRSCEVVRNKKTH